MKEKDITINELAGMVKTGFDEMGKQFEKVDKHFDKVENRLTTLEKGQEDIKLRLDNVAYRFELVEVLKRLKILEDIVLSKPKRYSRSV
jgi:DNA anti-recombination protein RmuC